ncbi:hypothetical protein, partial [Priestia aryabhattai]
GDTVKITVKASDKESGLQERAVLYYKMPITGKEKYISLNYNTETKSYEGTLPIEETMESGIWKVARLYITDKAENTLTMDGEIEGLEFTLTGTKADVTNPKLESVKVDKKKVKVGDTVKITVKASDKESGLQERAVLYYKMPITGKEKYIS